MARTKLSLGEIIAHPAVRPHLLSSHAAAIFTPKLDEMLWANANGENLIGETGKIKTGSNAINPSTLRQIELATEKLIHADEARATMRVRSGFKTKLVGFKVETISLAKGRKVVLLVSDALERSQENPGDIAKSVVTAMQETNKATAVFDGNGALVEVSKNYAGLKFTDSLLANLAQELEDAPDATFARIYKSKTMQYSGNASRLSTDPVLNVLTLKEGKKIPASKKRAVVKPKPKKTAPAKATVTKKEKPASKVSKTVATASRTKATNPKTTAAKIVATSPKKTANASSGPGKWFYQQAPVPSAKAVPAEVREKTKKAVEPTPRAVEKPKKSSVFKAPKARVVPTKTKPPIETAKQRTPKTAKPETPPKRDDSTKASGLVQDVEHTPVANRNAPIQKGNDEKSKDGFRFTETSRPVRFVWSTDADGRFTHVSEELAKTLGKDVAKIQDRTWKEVATNYRLNRSDEVSELLQKSETWSGKTVLWPIENSDMLAPVDLAGLPTFNRDKKFAGFNGFGIIRTADAVVDDRVEEETNTEIEAKIETKVETNSGRKLSNDEANAFTTIGKKLSDPKTDDKDTEPTDARKVRIPDHDVDTSILSRLPIPVLVYRGQDLLFANSNFYDATGYKNLENLADAGGVDALFGAHVSSVSSRDARIFHKNGSTLDVVPSIQRVPWDEHRAMLLTLRKKDRDGDGNVDEDGDHPSANNVSSLPSNTSPKKPSISAASQNTTSATEKKAISAVDAPKIETPQSERPLRPRAVNNVTPLRPLQREQESAFGKLPAEDLRNILDTASDGVIVMDQSGKVQGLNKSAEALFDLNSNDALNRDLTDLMAPESQTEVAEYLASFNETDAAAVLNDGREVIGQTSKGGLVPMFMSVGKLADGKARCAVLRDITHWKKVEEELVSARKDADEANQQKSEFLAKVSHEIRTPLNAIIGFSEMMISERMGPMENDTYRGYARDIKSSGNHVLDLVNDLLDIAKIESGNVDLDFGACELNRIVAETVALTQPQANKQRVIIRTSLSDAVPPIVADERSIKQIILNLVSNSIKFTKPGGQVIVSTVYQKSGEVILRVRDTGVGMSRDGLEKALQPFTQLAERSEVRGEGSGLGLPLTKTLVEANRAKFHIESEPDSGTMVEIEFPTQRVLAER